MWHQKPIQSILKEINTNETSGLTPSEVRRRLAKYGSNTLPTKKKPPLFLKFFSQFKDFLVIILLAATLVSFILGEYIDAVAILAIVLINAVIGFVQEIQAEKTLESLKQKEILYAIVLREETIEKIPASEIVPGDILILEEGAVVPADARIIESFSLRVDESILTGESQAASKNSKTLPDVSTPLADRSNMLYKDTKVLAGRGKAVVVATGKETEIGKIATYLEETKPTKTPLTIELDKVSRTLTIAICFIATMMFFINIVRNVAFVESLLISISLAVAAIPEGLPAIVTIVLSLGVKRLAEKKTIVKKLAAAETLGAVRIIATDKTGTLTQNKINVVKIILPDGRQYQVEGEGYEPAGTFFDEKKKIVDPYGVALLATLLRIGVLASNATFGSEGEVIGDTTEAALLAAAARGKINIDNIRKEEPRVSEVPFSSERKMMSVVVKAESDSNYFLYSKGAPEVILERCTIDPKSKKAILAQTRRFAADGLRSLAVAYRKLSKPDTYENNLVYAGLFLMQDPLRPEVKEAINSAKEAGIRTIMITGDHLATARTIARQAGIIAGNEKIFTEEDVSKLTKQQLAKKIKSGVSIFARISPMGKLAIVEAIKSIPHTQIAVTGDGVNDAPALQAAHIGVAMGKTGTDLTREVADIVITDDNYATIITAIEEGRIIFANLVKFVRYLISCNISEVLVVALGVIFSTPLPLMPIQILWINLITDGLPALALGMDKAEFDIMQKPPRDISVPILHKTRWVYMMAEGTIIGVTVFILFVFSLKNFGYWEAQTIAFTTLAFSQLVHAFNNRSTRKSLFEIGILGNKYLVYAFLFSILLQYLVVQTKTGNLLFKTQTLDLYGWATIAAASLIPFFVVEIKKKLRFRILP
jgi:Ca2+-transporting ATPase